MFTRRSWLAVTIILIIFPFNTTNATEVQRVETEGTIGFTGVYEPIGKPDPIPPENSVKPPVTEVAKPGGRLPQTNTRGSSWLTWLGVLIIGIFVLFGNKKRKNTKLNS